MNTNPILTCYSDIEISTALMIGRASLFTRRTVITERGPQIQYSELPVTREQLTAELTRRNG